MKTKAFFRLSIYAFIFLAFGCEEKNELFNFMNAGSSLNTLEIDSTYQSAADTPQAKNVLVEDFTAVRCVNCPRAQLTAKNIQASHPGRVVVSSIHVSDLATPYKESINNFKTVEGQNLLVYLGDYSSFPIGTIDRKGFNGSDTLFVTDILWKSLVNQQLALPTPVNISFQKKEYNDVDRTLNMQLKITYTQDVNVAGYVSVFISESNITDLQLTPNGVDSTYQHNHVLRAYLQPNNGLKLGDNFSKGKTILVNVSAKLESNWVPENCHITALVHQRDNKTEVYQVQETEIK